MSTTPVRQDAKFFAAVRSTGVRRSPDRWFAGVCGGLAERLGIDPLLVRGVLVALTVVGGLGLALYGACWLLLPDREPDGRIEVEAALRGELSGAAWLSGLLIVADLVLPRALLGVFNGDWRGPGWGFLITGLVGLLGWWLLRGFAVPALERPARPVSLVKETPAPEPVPGPQAGFGSPTERRAAARQEAREQAQEKAREAAERAREKAREAGDRAREKAQEQAARAQARRRPGSPLLGAAVFGLALLAAGAVVVTGLVTGLEGRALPLALSAFVVVLGLGAVVAGLRGRRTALVGLAWPAAFCAVAAALVPPSSNWTWQVERTWAPTAGSTGLSSAVGYLTVDPSRLASPATSATATIAAGRLDVLVPADATVLVDVTVLAGSLRWQEGAVVEVGPGETAAAAAAGGVHLRSVFAVGPDAARLAGSVQVRGDDPDDWTVPARTPELHAAAWAGEVRLGTAGSSTLEQP
ncbi:PspC domain-containing protein [Kineococcus rhizosphaerae]|uniref:Phage shock protein C (PspC) family protein n=1 Tax=Kineococcus rhizosphaerae TaxID=559628 RepID=A0A2T0R2N2_9ACTN|nr:PspC domain-containing protein [Kineococcus rhizosphaerae]PRY14035.1 phage shock protein C (PspC) family protein [Kineococcus rhizosphaerae]